MKRILLIITIIFAGLSVMKAQPTGYYNGTEGLDGEALKAALNDIIQDHTAQSYADAKYIMADSDRDPDNPDNVILVYTGRSQAALDYGTGGDFLNREHIWSKSHGFNEQMPMYSDVHNLKPADASVNQDKSNLDFDWGGEPHPEATGCNWDNNSWEPRDAVKGDVARIVFYMATRYEGENGEVDLEVVDLVNTSPNPEYGKLSALLEWNEMDPPDDFERNRNEVIFGWQKNRNPFIDHPEFVNLIWGGETASPVAIGNVQIDPVNPSEDAPATVMAEITSTGDAITEASIYWGLSFDETTNQVAMTANANIYTAEIPAQAEGTRVFYRIEATDGTNVNATTGYYDVMRVFTGTLVSIYDVQGQTSDSPYADQTISVSGVVTANFGDSYYIQHGTGEWNGLMIYDPGRNPELGDSIIATGILKEYYNFTELSDVTDYYYVSSNNPIPEFGVVTSGDLTTSATAEQWESVLVRINIAECTEAANNYGEWKVNDGSGECMIHTQPYMDFTPTVGTHYQLTGVVSYSYGNFRLELRSTADVVGSDITAPTITGIAATSFSSVEIVFSEDVDPSTAENPENYAIDDEIEVLSATLHAFQKSKVILTTTNMPLGNHVITISGITDLSGNVIEDAVFGFENIYDGINDVLNASFTVYPSPAHGNTLYLKSNEPIVNINIFNQTGQLVKQVNGTNITNIDVSELTNEIYFIKALSVNDKILVARFVK